MNSKAFAGAALVAAILALGGCGGGGGGSSPPPPAPPPADTTPPDTTLSGGPALLTTERAAGFALASTESNSTFEVSLDGGTYALTSSPYAISSLADGPHTVNVRARDAAGNVDATPASFTWTIDTTPPNAQVQFPGLVAYTDQASIRLRGTSLDPNAGTVSSVTVNAVAATTTDNFRHWTATVPVAIGANTYTIATTDDLGNTNSHAATVAITNRGLSLYSAGTMIVDNARNRLLVDTIHYGIASIRLNDGVAEIFSGVQRGTGTYTSSASMVIDAAHNRLLTHDGRVFAIDLDTGNRTALTSPEGPDYEATGGMDYDAAHDVVYAAGYAPPRVIARTVANGSLRIVTSDTVGTGPAMTRPMWVSFDSSAAGAGQRLLVADIGASPGTDQSRVFAVDISTGNRTVLSTSTTPAVGTGAAIYAIGSMSLDAANNRVLVASYSQTEAPRVIAIDLTTGNRTVVASMNGPTIANAQFVYDGAAQRAFLSVSDRARVMRLDLATQQLVPFYDTTVGTGPVPLLISGLQLDGPTDAPTLIALSQTAVFNSGSAVLRVEPTTGVRTLISGDGVGSGYKLYNAQGGFRDTRAGAQPNQLIVYDCGVIPRSLVSVDLANGNRTYLSTPATPVAASYNSAWDNGRLISATRPALTDDFTLVEIDVASGTLTPISGASRGAGPKFFSGTYGYVNAIGTQRPFNGTARYIVATNDGTVTAVDPATGDRTRVFATSGTQVLEIDDMDIDSGRGRAFLVSPYGPIYTLDLANGSLGMVTGSDTYFANSVGAGPEILGYGGRLRVDLFNNVAYAVSNFSTLIAVDLTTGQRAIISR